MNFRKRVDPSKNAKLQNMMVKLRYCNIVYGKKETENDL
jgi:hypothetical protein